jgi:nucleoside-diphosphate-sugar epimerase
VRILITGGAGYLGANLAVEYLAQGHEVLVIDNLATGYSEALPAVPRLELVVGSVADRELVDAAFEHFAPTHIIHSGASYKDPNDWREDVATNVNGTINVVEAARRAGVNRFVYFQTALCYGQPDLTPIPVNHATRPFTSYGISKTAGEAYVAISDLSWISLRIANVTGPRLAIGPIPTFYKRLKAGQKCFCTEAIRDFLDMFDFLELMRVALSEEAPTGIFNVSTGEGHTISEVFCAVASCLGVNLPDAIPVVPPNYDDVPNLVLDPSVTHDALGWRASVGFSDTIARVIHWYDIHGVPTIRSHLQPTAAR